MCVINVSLWLCVVVVFVWLRLWLCVCDLCVITFVIMFVWNS